MKQALLKNFRSLDAASFAALMHRLGFTEAACYRLTPGAYVQVLSTATEPASLWPPSVDVTSHYTTATAETSPHGWVRPAELPINPKAWPKATVLYVPEQLPDGGQLIFTALLATGKRVRQGTLDGILEAVTTRIYSWDQLHSRRYQALEQGVQEHLQHVETDLRMLIDHELRTPLASVQGYLSLLRDVEVSGAPTRQEYLAVLDKELARALEALDKLSLVLNAGDKSQPSAGAEVFDAEHALRQLCARVSDESPDLTGNPQAAQAVQVRKLTDQPCMLLADPLLFDCAVWEVLKNAVTHTRSAAVIVQFYTADNMLVIDIEDDGTGVSAGAEELIFLRFFQDPGTAHKRRGKRGLGLGLFLARQIAERHLGRLTYIRQRGGSMFRFLWPLAR